MFFPSKLLLLPDIMIPATPTSASVAAAATSFRGRDDFLKKLKHLFFSSTHNGNA
jgi:hypothetical protein